VCFFVCVLLIEPFFVIGGWIFGSKWWWKKKSNHKKKWSTSSSAGSPRESTIMIVERILHICLIWAVLPLSF
jgi:hypothetical protein